MAGLWRWIVHPPADGAWNMAVDEALLRSTTASGGDALPILRLYGWSPPALSLGRAQASDGAHDPSYLRREAIHLVRRPTGGGAVLHEHERTYAVVAPAGGPFGRTLRETYAAVAAALVDAYRRLGVSVDRSEAGGGPPGPRPSRETLCFARASVDEIVFRGRKLAGSAQLRTRGAFLQHGSMPVRADALRLEGATGSAADPGFLGDLERAAGRELSHGAVDDALAAAVESVFGVRLEPSDLTRDERMLATRLRAWKYLSATWTLLGRAPGRSAAGQGRRKRSIAQ